MMNLDESKERATPWWETAAMVVSFGLLWAYLIARQVALKAAAQSGAAHPQIHLSPLWTVAQVAAIAVLLFVLVRRMQRAATAMRAASQIQPGMPPGFKPTKFKTDGISTNGNAKNGHAPNGVASSKKKKDNS